jgi:hypothetical protein
MEGAMKKLVLFCLVCLFLAGTAYDHSLNDENSVLSQLKPIKPKLLRVNFELRNITAPSRISCQEPFLTLSVEVWNVGNMDYDPANGQAVLYGDLHDAQTNAPITFGTVPMNRVIRRGQFQKWTFNFDRDSIPNVFENNFLNANELKNLFVADEQGVTNDPDYSNNIGYTRSISMNCLPFVKSKLLQRYGVVLRRRGIRTKIIKKK